jgi:hypothetical protein
MGNLNTLINTYEGNTSHPSLIPEFPRGSKELAMVRHVTATVVVDKTFTGVGYVWEFHKENLFSYKF